MNQLHRGVQLWNRAKKIIPGGNQLLSKRSEMFLPERWPSYYKKAKGVHVWDLDDHLYTDMSIMGMGTCVLGYANDDVNRAVMKAVNDGSMCTLNSFEEVELAEKLIQLHPWADQVRYARTGGEACAMAVRISRAASGKDKVAFCGYHGWHDWYLSSNLADAQNLDGQLLPGLAPLGVPRALQGTAIPFQYGDVTGLERIVQENKGEVGVIMMEVQRKGIDLEFLKQVRQIASQIGAVLVFDEVTSGYRLRAGGLHILYEVVPDLVVLGKAMGNGFPIAAVLGQKHVMEMTQSTFISSTFWSESVGFAAALEVIRQFENQGVAQRLMEAGNVLIEGLRKLFDSYGLRIAVEGLVSAPHIVIEEENALEIKTLFTQEMLKRDFLASTLIFVSIAHSRKIVEAFLHAAEEVTDLISSAQQAGNLESLLEGPVCHAGFTRVT